eukprot:CAMPEP_0201282852 /NCGR_PEP_ID=MMETSP1317-20130820/6877_1 /ASSEMBLY_ACC=CAM_ASM_000770 /TAXON_ID=187299 /ORGANISM="Undescribed Undescribed, Strain Undescribed" /LENGTH=199 /DNA_ID=CAMNT_0047596999 /DNA_START=1549 /DNA_END=2149 /DNA_ORIENTATION=-
MNRALYLARPDPNEEDLIFTAMSIYNSFGIVEESTHESVIEALAKAYSRLKLKYSDTDYADVYGLRDFYHMIKQVAKALHQNPSMPREEVAGVAKKAIERNFGGNFGRIFNAVKEMGDFFTEEYHLGGLYRLIPDSNVLDLIKENIVANDSRYLMLIGRGDAATYILDKCLDYNLADRRTMVGSTLENDKNQEEMASGL